MPVVDVPERARVVIVGGGIVGCSVAYHLAQLGWTDVVLLEQGQLSCGTTCTRPASSGSCAPTRR